MCRLWDGLTQRLSAEEATGLFTLITFYSSWITSIPGHGGTDRFGPSGSDPFRIEFVISRFGKLLLVPGLIPGLMDLPSDLIPSLLGVWPLSFSVSGPCLSQCPAPVSLSVRPLSLSVSGPLFLSVSGPLFLSVSGPYLSQCLAPISLF